MNPEPHKKKNTEKLVSGFQSMVYEMKLSKNT